MFTFAFMNTFLGWAPMGVQLIVGFLLALFIVNTFILLIIKILNLIPFL